MSQASLALLVDVKATTISNYENGVSTPAFSHLIEISKIFEVSIDELVKSRLNPEGLKPSPKPSPKQSPTLQSERSTNIVGEAKASYGNPIVVTIDQDGRNNIVMIDVQAAAGLPAHISDPDYYKDLPAFTLPGIQYQSGDYICLQITGDSMHPTIYHQDWLIAKRIYDLRHDIREGYVHILATKDGVVAKRLLNRLEERGKLVCQSDNEQYPTYEEPENQIRGVWKVEGRLSFNLANINADIRKDINGLRADVENLKSKLIK